MKKLKWLLKNTDDIPNSDEPMNKVHLSPGDNSKKTEIIKKKMSDARKHMDGIGKSNFPEML